MSRENYLNSLPKLYTLIPYEKGKKKREKTDSKRMVNYIQESSLYKILNYYNQGNS